MTDRFLTRYEVEKMTGISRSALYRMMAENGFPASYKFGRSNQQGAVRWSENEIRQWISERPRYQPDA